MKKLFTNALRLTGCLLIVAMCFCVVPAAMATDQEENSVDTEAIEALETMSSYLRTLSTFKVKSTFYRDEVLTSGQKILVSGTNELTVKLPNKLLTEVTIPEKNKDFAMYFDGNTLTLYGKNNNFYVSEPAPGTLKDLVFKTFVEKGIELPLQDLFLWGTDVSSNDTITSAFVIGKTTLDNKPCIHYAYRQADVDWQIWIKEGNRPLPLQLVITTTTESSQPQYSARLRWDLTPPVTEDMFVFTPPQGAHAIDFLPASAGSQK